MSYPTYGPELTEAKKKVDMALAHKSMEYQQGRLDERKYFVEILKREGLSGKGHIVIDEDDKLLWVSADGKVCQEI